MKTLSILATLVIGITVIINMEKMTGVVFTNKDTDNALIVLRPSENTGSLTAPSESGKFTIDEYLDWAGEARVSPLMIIVPAPRQSDLPPIEEQ